MLSLSDLILLMELLLGLSRLNFLFNSLGFFVFDKINISMGRFSFILLGDSVC